MSLKKKLTALITMFVLVVVMAIVGVYAATSATINMGGSISFQASGVYAKLTGGISGGDNTTFNPLLFTEADANSPSETDKETWNNNELSLTKENPTRTITVTVENLSTERSMYVMIEDVGEVENITKSVTVLGNNNAANKGIEVAKGTIVTYTITLSITNTNNSVNGRYEYIIHLSDEPIASKINIQAFSNNEELGTVTGGVKGVEENQEVTLIATPNGTNEFLGWATEKDITNIVSIEPTYSFTYKEGIPTNYYAVFNETIEKQEIKGITYNLYKEAKLAEVVSSEGATLTGELDLSNGVWFNSEKYKIYSIGDTAFVDQQITGVVIPKTVTKIGMGAFFGTRLSSVTIPSSVVEIGDGAFLTVIFTGIHDQKMEGTLKEIKLEEGNKNYYVDIVEGKGVALISNDGELISYASGSSLTSYSIPNGVTTISSLSFAYCMNLENLVIPNSVESIGETAICYSKLVSLNIPNSVKFLGTSALASALTSIKIEGDITETSEEPLANGYNTLKTFIIGSEVTFLPNNIFSGINIMFIKVEEGNTTFSVKTGANGYGLYKGDELVYSLDSNIVEVGELLYKISGITGNYQAEVIGAGENITKHINIPSTITSEKFLGETINVISAGDWNHNLFIESITIENGVKRFFSRYCRNLFKITLLGDLEQGWSPQTFYSDGEWYKDDIKVTEIKEAGIYIRK